MLVAYSVAHNLTNGIAHSIGAYVDKARNTLVRKALENESTHLLFVDQDMLVPQDALHYLLKHDAPVVGAHYVGKAHPYETVAFNFDPFRRVTLGDYDQDGVTEVGGVGMGCTLIDTSVFTQMIEKFGDELWFNIVHDTGEDVWFAQRCAEMGIPILLDAAIQCGHIGETIYTAGHALGAADYESETVMVRPA